MELLRQSLGDIIDLQYVEDLLEMASRKQRPGTQGPTGFSRSPVPGSLIKSEPRTGGRVPENIALK